MLYRTCDKCGSNLDPNEICTDCKKNEAALQQQEQPLSKTTTHSLPASEEAVKEGGAADV